MRLFSDTLRDLRGGQCVDALTHGLADLVRACLDTGKPGEITLTIIVKPLKNSGEAVQIIDKIGNKLPTFERDASLFFVTSDGSLTRNNPRQERLDLREVDTTREAPRTLDGTTGGA